jgi:hypothetical protein
VQLEEHKDLQRKTRNNMMKRTLLRNNRAIRLSIGALALAGLALPAQAQLEIGEAHHFTAPMGADRGTDTVVTAGVDAAFLAGQIAYYDTPGGGNLLGNNEYGVQEVAQQFTVTPNTVVDEVLFLFAEAVYGSGNPNSRITAKLYDLSGTTGTTSTTIGTAPCPGTPLANVDIPMSDVTATGFTSAVFNPAITFTGTAAVAGFGMANMMAGDSVNLAATAGGYAQDDDRTWIKLAAGWGTSQALLASGGDFDLLIALILTPGIVGVGENDWFNGMQLTIYDSPEGVEFGYALEQASKLDLIVVDATGKRVVERSLGTRSAGAYREALGTGSLNAGAYYLILNNQGRTIAKKFVVR